jgi:hypothetical protein
MLQSNKGMLPISLPLLGNLTLHPSRPGSAPTTVPKFLTARIGSSHRIFCGLTAGTRSSPYVRNSWKLLPGMIMASRIIWVHSIRLISTTETPNGPMICKFKLTLHTIFYRHTPDLVGPMTVGSTWQNHSSQLIMLVRLLSTPTSLAIN